MKKLWKGMFMTPHLWESIYMAHRAGYDGCGAMILPRGGKGPLHELLAEPGLWSRVQTALDETGLFWTALEIVSLTIRLMFILTAWECLQNRMICETILNLRENTSWEGCRPASGPQIRTWQWSGLTTCALFAESMD